MDERPPRVPVEVTVDDREPRPGLADALAHLGRDVVVARLPVGDVAIGTRILVERKTVADFVLSLETGRLFRQAWALRRASWRPLLVVEGEDAYDAGRLASRQIRGVVASLLVGCGVPLVRTCDVRDTAAWVLAILEQEERRVARLGTPPPPRDARVAMDVLGALPGVGDQRARRLIERFGSAGAALAASEEDLLTVDGIGPATARAIRNALAGVAADVGESR